MYLILSRIGNSTFDVYFQNKDNYKIVLLTHWLFFFFKLFLLIFANFFFFIFDLNFIWFIEFYWLNIVDLKRLFFGAVFLIFFFIFDLNFIWFIEFYWLKIVNLVRLFFECALFLIFFFNYFFVIFRLILIFSNLTLFWTKNWPV